MGLHICTLVSVFIVSSLSPFRHVSGVTFVYACPSKPASIVKELQRDKKPEPTPPPPYHPSGDQRLTHRVTTMPPPRVGQGKRSQFRWHGTNSPLTAGNSVQLPMLTYITHWDACCTSEQPRGVGESLGLAMNELYRERCGWSPSHLWLMTNVYVGDDILFTLQR